MYRAQAGPALFFLIRLFKLQMSWRVLLAHQQECQLSYVLAGTSQGSQGKVLISQDLGSRQIGANNLALFSVIFSELLERVLNFSLRYLVFFEYIQGQTALHTYIVPPGVCQIQCTFHKAIEILHLVQYNLEFPIHQKRDCSED